MNGIDHYLTEKRADHLEELKTFLRIPSISTSSEHAGDVVRGAAFVAEQLRRIGFEHAELLVTSRHPVVYADWLHAPGKPTVLVYGHYDVQPPEPLDLWETPPFEPDIRGGMIYARGSSDNKGQVFMHLKAFEALLATTGKLPVNLKVCFEGEEEIGSPSLPAVLQADCERWQTDLVVLSDTAMIGEGQPSVCYGLRGMAGFEISVKGANSDLHSGSLYGGAVQNATHALVELIGTMRGKNGKITIDGFYDKVRPITEEEREAFRALQFDDEKMAARLGVSDLFGEEGFTTLERVWTRPTLEVNGLWGGYQGEGIKTIIPCEAHAKITCRLVPGQDPEEILDLIERHIETHTPAGVDVTVTRSKSSRPYVTPIDHPVIQFAREALEEAFQVPAHFIRAGGSIPIVEEFAQTLQAPVVMIGFALPTCNAHAPNEHFSLEIFDKGMRALCRYWYGLDAAVKGW